MPSLKPFPLQVRKQDSPTCARGCSERSLLAVFAVLAAMFSMLLLLLPLLSGCSPAQGASKGDEDKVSFDEKDISDLPEPEYPLEYPAAWSIADACGLHVGEPVKVVYLPDVEIVPRRHGVAVAPEEAAEIRSQWESGSAGSAVVKKADGSIVEADPSMLLVNLPDIAPRMCFDIVYSYSSTSKCAGMGIPGVTGEKLPGYADAKQQDAYLAREEFACPCAYGTALKALEVEDELEKSGYRLLVFDVYRPMSAQYRLSDLFVRECSSNPAMRDALGGWSMGWFVADGPSGHNYGTDMDVGVCDLDGRPIEMPSHFDAFDEAGHLCSSQLDSASISESSYRAAVAQNPACLALHRAFKAAGFSELASEWWHFGDGSTEAANRSAVGGGGLDFEALLPATEAMPG